ncbi:hypothetical protein FHS43_006088 [Streptosporangium becharense]|uniref:Uncharacterized protein n=2 Tax=Streptosporangium becharense TaxID=1816182 RepID=A0A7W9IIM1_9ACTN|nr:hypothetical protein [Streptosporangium becharense]MBB5820823.1 hypothetical protein [Streptosporangium becharense]
MSMDLTANPHVEMELHRYAEALLAELAAGSVLSVPPAALTDVPGHWLAPAVEALTLLTRGEDALDALGRAAQCDERRTALFLCLALAVSGQGDRIHASWLGTAFGDLSLDRPVTHGQRALWLAAARGAYGPVGKIFVLRKLDAVSASPASEPDRWLNALTPAEPSVAVSPSLAGFPDLAGLPELADPVRAAARLAQLRDRCAEITSAGENRRGDRAGGAADRRDHLRRASTGSDAPDGLLDAPDELPGGLAGLAAAQADHSGEATVVWSEDEPLAVLRRLISTADASEAPAKPLTGYLLSDLRPGSHPHLAAIALHVAAPIVREAAENLERATHVEPPEAVAVPILGHRVTLHPEGPDPESLADAEAHVTSEGMPVRGRPWDVYALFVLTAVALVAALVVPTPPSAALAALALLPAAGGGYRLWQRRRRERADAEYVAAQLSELRETAQSAVWALHEYARESEERAQRAKTDLAELIRLLRRGPRAG